MSFLWVSKSIQLDAYLDTYLLINIRVLFVITCLDKLNLTNINTANYCSYLKPHAKLTIL
jgi:hypothetical protein